MKKCLYIIISGSGLITFLRRGFLFAACFLCLSLANAGRPDKAGTAAAPELLIPVGARTIGLGGASLASVSGVEAIAWNPAGLARGSDASGVQISHMSYLAGIGVESLLAGTTLEGFGSFGLSIKTLSVGDINVTTEDQPDGNGETVSPVFLTVGGTFARAISDRIVAGVNVKLIYEQMGNVSTTGVAVDCGVQYQKLGGLEGLAVGVAVKNLGPPIRFGGTGLLRNATINDATNNKSLVMIEAAAADLPSTIEIGLAYSVPLSEKDIFNFSTLFQNNNFSSDEYRFGAEWGYGGRFFCRAGYSIQGESGGGEYIFGPSAGVGMRTEITGLDISVDYAFRAARYFSGNHVFSVLLGF